MMSTKYLMKTNKTLTARPVAPSFPLGANVSVVAGPKLELRPPLLLHCYLDNLFNGRGNEEVELDTNEKDDIANRIALTTRTPDGVTISQYTFAQLHDLASTAARGFNKIIKTYDINRRHPTELDDVPFVAFCTRKSPELCIAMLGALKAGCAYVPVSYGWPVERWRYILNDARPSLIEYDKGCKHLEVLQKYCAEQNTAPPVLLDTLFAENDSKEEEEEAYVKDHHTAVVLYTSGTTGNPKGVKLPHRGLMNALQFRLQNFPYFADEEGLLKTVMTFSDSVLEMFETWFNLRPLIVITKDDLIDVKKFLKYLENNRIYRIVVPSVLQALIDLLALEKRTFNGPMLLLSTDGEPLTVELVERFFQAFPHTRLANFYGQTECCADLNYEIWDTLADFRASLSRTNLISIGRPIDNLIVYILNPDMQPVKHGEPGELYVSGPSVCSSYIGSATRGKFLPNLLLTQHAAALPKSGHEILLKTGDIAVYEHGQQVFYLVGRSDDMVKISGQKVHLAEVLKAMQALPYVQESSVISLVRIGEIKIIGFVRFASTGGKDNNDEVLLRASREELARTLPIYAQPRLISYPNAFPRTVAGKVSKKQLIEFYQSNYESLTLKNSGNTVLGVLATSIGITEQDVQLDKSFVENGGSSLKILPAVLALNKAGFVISLEQFLAAKTVDELMYIVQARKQKIQADLKNNANEKVHPRNGLASSLSAVPSCSFEVVLKPINELDKDEVINVVSESFGNYSDLAIFGESSVEEMRAECISEYPYFLADGLSFAFVRKLDGRVVAVSLSTDNETFVPPGISGPGSQYNKDVYDLLEIVDNGIKPHIPHGKGKACHAWMAAVLPSVSVADKVALMYMLIDAEIKQAKKLKFECIVAETASPLVEQLVHGFVRHEILFKIRPRDFVSSDGRMPWSNYPEDYYLYGDVMWLNDDTNGSAGKENVVVNGR